MTQKALKLDIVRVEEPWAVAHLADGSEVRVKLVFKSCERVLDDQGKPAFAEDGKPMVTTHFGWIIDVDAPEAAMKKVPTR